MKKIIAIMLICIFVSCADTDKQHIVIFHAGSLSPLFKECKSQFEKIHNFTVLLEASGSVDAARKIVDLKKQCDVIALADAKLFESLLKEYCAYWIGFAGNEMVLAYSPESKYATQLAINWLDALKNYPVVCSRSDPLRDPCGYRTLLVWKLASLLYHNPKLEALCEKRSPVQYMQPKEIDAITLVETGACDAVWIYKSLAVQRNLPFVTFDERINLSNTRYNNYYKNACITLKDFMRMYTICGDAILYGVSIPKNAGNTQGAVEFIQFLLSPKGKELIQRHGFTSTLYVNNLNALPQPLKKVVAQ
ncbi:MAG: extracellular solute-binding protein [Spirochaetes bacterium]|nr:extracellular solute-binding protein [Spirochaetota bacterium]